MKKANSPQYGLSDSSTLEPSQGAMAPSKVIPQTLIRLTLAAAFLVAISSFNLAAASHDQATRTDSAALMPPDTLLYAHLDAPHHAIARLEEHVVFQRLMQIEGIRQAFQTDEFKQFQAGLTLAEFRLKKTWRELIESAAGEGVTFALVPQQNAIILVLEGDNSEEVKRLFDESITFVKAMNQNKPAQGASLQRQDYRDFEVYQAGELVVFRMEQKIVVSNQAEAAKAVIDRHQDKTDSLLTNARFSPQEPSSDTPTLTAWLDIRRIREANLAKEVFAERSQNFAAELLFGGIQGVLQQADQISLSFELHDASLALNVQTPFKPEWVDGPREFFFGESAQGIAPAPLQPQNMLLNIVTYRDIGGLWLAKEDLFEERVIAELSQADSNLSTLFAGVDFGEEVLGAAQPGFQIVASRQSFADRTTPMPAIQLPQFAVVFRLQEPQQVQRRFKIAFQSLIGFLNIGLGQQGQPQFEITTLDQDGARITSATYLVDPDEDEGRINYNFSPSMVLADDRLVLSSTKSLAQELADLIQSDQFGDTPQANTWLRLESSMLHEVLHDNQEQLIVQNMLEEGNDRAQAAGEIATLLELLKLTRGLDVRLEVEADQLELDATLSFPSSIPTAASEDEE